MIIYKPSEALDARYYEATRVYVGEVDKRVFIDCEDSDIVTIEKVSGPLVAVAIRCFLEHNAVDSYWVVQEYNFNTHKWADRLRWPCHEMYKPVDGELYEGNEP